MVALDVAIAERPVPFAEVEAAHLAREPAQLPHRCRLLLADNGLASLPLAMEAEGEASFLDLVLSVLR
jgi:hypothetical protein